ncbi:hypothetical protein OS493_038906 [Desmophyllum pertusum]|uniref:Uncharacterized protein n=1 Tax=Desmophyllum pertusum TaxID=174260 RepID=A0A9W9Y6W9_9CNID|nr:hypothetical protein OS493_038906 [Desmophyllum pertusum]
MKRLRLKETVRKYYIELPENQSTELCMLIEAIEESKQVTGKKGNRWSLATIRAALAVYTSSPSAFDALHDLKITPAPCSKVLRKILKDGAEKAGVR